MCVHAQRPSALWKAVMSLLHSLLRKIRKLLIVLWGSINTIWDKRLVCKQLWGWRRQCPERRDLMGSAKAKVGSWGGRAVRSLATDNGLHPNQPFRTVSHGAGPMTHSFTRIQDKAQGREQQLMMGTVALGSQATRTDLALLRWHWTEHLRPLSRIYRYCQSWPQVSWLFCEERGSKYFGLFMP